MSEPLNDVDRAEIDENIAWMREHGPMLSFPCGCSGPRPGATRCPCFLREQAKIEMERGS